MVEGAGFEPAVSQPVGDHIEFQASAFGHSANLPNVSILIHFLDLSFENHAGFTAGMILDYTKTVIKP